MFVIRMGSLTEEQYLDRDGKWGPYPKAKRFSTQAAAVRFMEAHDASSGGIFPCWRAKQLWECRKDRMQRRWAWRLPFIWRFGLLLCHRMERGHADRIALAHDIRILRKLQ